MKTLSQYTARRYLLLAAVVGLLALNGAILMTLLQPETPKLTVSILDIGQGDSILIEGPTGVTVLIDGGPDRSVLRQLGRELPFWKRSIDMVIATHPDKDHIAGLAGVLARYRVSYFMSPGIPGKTSFAQALDAAVDEEPGVQEFVARRGMRIHLGGSAYADVLYPDKDVSAGETNDGSIVMRIVYGETSFMMTGDMPSTVEAYLVALDPSDTDLRTTVLKAGHHGSRSSTDALWLDALRPEIVAISAGADNSYGNPAPEVLERISAIGARALSTIDEGTIRLVSDGVTVTHH